jgi:hypothetical protein
MLLLVFHRVSVTTIEQLLLEKTETKKTKFKEIVTTELTIFLTSRKMY